MAEAVSEAVREIVGHQFLDQYPKVFDENGDVLPCGRYMTIILITLADGAEPGVDHGNSETGIMNLENMRSLYRTLINKQEPL